MVKTYTQSEVDALLEQSKVDAKAIRADEREKVMNEPLTKEMWERFRSEVRAEALEEAAELMLVLDLCGEEMKAATAIRGLK